MNAHRVRRLRWQARASTPADAFALRSLLREHGDACEGALDRAFDEAAPAHEVWHLPRLALSIRLPDLHGITPEGLAERVEVALRVALADAASHARGTAGAVGSTTGERPVVATLARHTAAADSRVALQHYLATGLMPWTLAGLAAEQAQRVLADAAVAATEAAFGEWQVLDAMLPSVEPAARIGALLRWLPLLPPALRRRWVAAHPASLALPADVLRSWRAWLDDDAADRIEWQALWLAGPLAPPELRARIDEQLGAVAIEAPFLHALRRALEIVAPGQRGNKAQAANRANRANRANQADQADRADHDDPAAALSSLLVPLAGLVLLHPWLPRLLAACGVVDAGGRQVAPALLPRACAVLHALACGDAEVAEHHLPLVKLLLGRPPDEPLTAALPALTAAEHDEIAALLTAVREHWSALRGTGVDGLRLSFLQRRGLLARGDGAWQLRLQTEPFDMLLGLLPWPIGLVRLPWMLQPLVVEWPTP